MDPVRAIAPITALACFTLVTTRGMFAGNPAATTLKEALFAMFLGFIAGSLAQVIVAKVVDEHNREYTKANPVRPVGWSSPDEIIEVEEAVDEPGTTAAAMTETGGANPPSSKKL